MLRLIRKGLELLGYEIRKRNSSSDYSKRNAGNMKTSLLGLKSCGLEANCIMDVGSNKAHWSRTAADIYPESFFILIEPQIEMKQDLDQFCLDFPSSKYFLAGAGAEKGILTLTVWEDLLGSSLLPSYNAELKKQNKQRDIPMITIDDLIKENKFKIPDLIKLDIQGFELEALKGASCTFGVTEAYILEVSLFNFSDGLEMPVFSDVLNFMLERGYVVYDFPGFLRRPYDNALGQCDVCFVKKDGILRKSNKWN